jgi:butyryl-CoA dehydrogenase
MWLDVALASDRDTAAGQGRHAACRFFFHHELPRIDAWLAVVRDRDDTCRTMQEEWF